MAIITRQKDPFKQVESDNRGQPRSVGNTIGARRTMKAQTAPAARPAVAKPIDKFSNKRTNSASLARFSPKASFQKLSMPRHSGGALKPAVLDYIEQGTRPLKVSEKTVLPPSDRAILNFLDKVINKSS